MFACLGHPALTAAAVASIDELSGGRAFLVYGAGGSLSLGPRGIERDRPLAHVREALDVCRRLFDGEPGSYRDIVCLNAAAALMVAGAASDIRDGVEIAARMLSSGAAGDKLNELVTASNL